MITVGIPVKEPCSTLPYVLRRIQEIQDLNPGLISEVLTETKGSLPEARVSMARQTQAALILNLDADTLIPVDYLSQAVRLFKTHKRVGALALNYSPNPQNHLAFGTSVMPTLLLLRTYDWKGYAENGTCECLHMWRRLTSEGWILATLPMAAEHKQEIPSQHKNNSRPGQ